MLLALRSHSELRHIFTEVASCTAVNAGRPSLLLAQASQTALLESGELQGAAREAATQKMELQRMLDILHEVDEDGSGTLEWEEVLEFFRRSGYLLEYVTKAELNDPAFLEASEDHSLHNDDVASLADMARTMQPVLESEEQVVDTVAALPSLSKRPSLSKDAKEPLSPASPGPTPLRRNSVRPASRALVFAAQKDLTLDGKKVDFTGLGINGSKRQHSADFGSNCSAPGRQIGRHQSADFASNGSSGGPLSPRLPEKQRRKSLSIGSKQPYRERSSVKDSKRADKFVSWQGS